MTRALEQIAAQSISKACKSQPRGLAYKLVQLGGTPCLRYITSTFFPSHGHSCDCRLVLTHDIGKMAEAVALK